VPIGRVEHETSSLCFSGRWTSRHLGRLREGVGAGADESERTEFVGYSLR
jgi:hypothetical protein